MKTNPTALRAFPSILLFMLLPLLSRAAIFGDIATTSYVFQTINIFVWVTSFISILLLIFPGEANKTPYHVFNMIVVVVFHSVALYYLIHHKEYYNGFEHLSNGACVKKYFLSLDTNSLLKRVIELGFICNIIYVTRYGRRFYLNTN